jgi:CubicO group peptidase (beta-lactamase class C family)
MQKLVDEGVLAGAVCLVQQGGKPLRLDAVGWRDIATRAPMRPDTVFQIMSQAKPFIATAILMLQDEGRLDVEDQVEKYLPEFSQPWLISSQDDTERRLRRAEHRITIAHLLSHSSGLPDAAPVTANFATKMRFSLAEVTAILAQQPLEAEPGSRWRYSNQGIAAAARVVEVVSGMDYERFVGERIFAPLGMRESTFRPAPSIWPRIASAYELEGRKLTELGPGTPGYGDLKYRRGVRYILPEAGIYSTASDVVRFHQLFLDRGVNRGRRLLSERAVDLMLTPRISMTGPNVGGAQQGLGWRLEPGASPAPASGLPAGSFHHSGALGSFGWGDPGRGVAGILLVQLQGSAQSRDVLIKSVGDSLSDG